MQFVLLDSNGIRLEVNNRKIAEEFQSICRLNNRLLITHVKEEISMKLKTIFFTKCKSSVQFGHSVVSYALRPHEPHHTRPPCPSPTPGGHPNSCPSSWWCHPTISSSVAPRHPLSPSPPQTSYPASPPALTLSQHQGLFQWATKPWKDKEET